MEFSMLYISQTNYALVMFSIINYVRKYLLTAARSMPYEFKLVRRSLFMWRSL